MNDTPDDKPDDPITRMLGDFLSANPTPPPEVEPSADLMGLAHNLFEQFTAYRRAGFDDRQAFALTTTALATILGRSTQ